MHSFNYYYSDYCSEYSRFIFAMAEHDKSPTDLDDLFNYDIGLDDIFGDNAAQTANVDIPKPPTGNPSALGLGLDEEVKVTKKRKPVAKLDEGL